MVDRPRPRRLLVLLLPTLTILGCSGVEPAPPAGASAVEMLADHAARLADHLQVDNGCRTLAEAEALLERAADGVATGEVPREVATEIRRVVAEVTADVRCGAEPPPVTDEQVQPADEASVAAGDGSEVGSDAAQEPAPQQEEEREAAPPTSSPAPAAAATTAGRSEVEKNSAPPGKRHEAPGRSKRPGDRGRGGGR